MIYLNKVSWFCIYDEEDVERLTAIDQKKKKSKIKKIKKRNVMKNAKKVQK
jgi:hypothetical protein